MKTGKISEVLQKHEIYLLFITMAIFCFLSIKTGGVFVSAENLLDLVSGVAMDGILAAGVLVVLISGGIDISFMAAASTVQYITAFYLLNTQHSSPYIMLLIAAGTGIALGMINGILVYSLKVPAIIITIATMNIYFGILIWISKGKLLNNFPQWFSAKTQFTTGVMPLLCLALAFIVTAFLLARTRMGRSIFAIGGNAAAAKRLDISLLKTNLFVYGYLGFFAAMGGVLQMYLSQTVAPKTLVGSEMNVLAMVVLGGAALTGGKGSAAGTLLGVVLIGMIGNGIVLLGISSYWFDFVTGLVVLLSFCITGYGVKKKDLRRNTHAWDRKTA